MDRIGLQTGFHNPKPILWNRNWEWRLFAGGALFREPLRSPDWLLQPSRPQSNINAKRSGQRSKSAGKTLTDGFKLPIATDAVDSAEDHGRFNWGVFAQIVTGNFRTVFFIDNANVSVADLAEVLFAHVAQQDSASLSPLLLEQSNCVAAMSWRKFVQLKQALANWANILHFVTHLILDFLWSLCVANTRFLPNQYALTRPAVAVLQIVLRSLNNTERFCGVAGKNTSWWMATQRLRSSLISATTLRMVTVML